MACRSIDRLGMARGRAIAAAIIAGAEVRTAFKHLAWNFDLRLARVVARRLRPAARIFRNAARLRRIGFVLCANTNPSSIPRRCRSCRRGRSRSAEMQRPATCAQSRRRTKVLSRKFTLPGVRHMLAAGRKLIAPGKFRAVKPAARGEFPFGLGRQVFAGPFGVGQRVHECHMHDRMIVEPVDVAVAGRRGDASRRPLGISTIDSSRVDRLGATAARRQASPHRACAAARPDNPSDQEESRQK